MEVTSRYRGCLLGLACGDAVGTTVEFRPRGSFPPVTDMVGGGPFRLPVGAWTDDTSMALCLATSLADLGRFDAADQMTRYCRWWNDGYLSSTGRCFDIGNTTSNALSRFENTGDPYSGSNSAHASGNGSIMRLAPVPIFYHPNHLQAIAMAAESSRTTHAALECIEACQLLAAIILQAFDGADKDEVLFTHDPNRFQSTKIQAIAAGEYRTKNESDITGSGYVVQSLEAAAWSFLQTDSYRDAILKAVNLGDDADTTAAVCGQIAGAFYGEDGIPAEWLTKLVMADEIRSLADRLGQHRPAAGP